MCLYPTLRQNPKYKSNKKNGGNIPPVNDKRVLLVPTGCGNCMECRKQKSRDWQARLLEDIKTNTNGKCVTLTFSNESIKNLSEYAYQQNEKRITQHYKNIPTNKQPQLLTGYDLDNEIATLAVRLFLERWRKKYKKSLRHWLITELGHKGTENIHLHGIIWTDHGLDEIENHWKYGFIHKGKKINLKNNTYTYKNFVNERTINYNTKYVTKIDVQHKTYKPIILTSSGIGSSYTNGHGDHINNKYNGTKTNETYRTRQGYKLSLPKYLRNKIYTDQEREQLWLQKLDKNERWVDKQRIDISKSMDTYYKALDQAREKNKQLGYGTNEKNWSREKYERDYNYAKQLEMWKATNYQAQVEQLGYGTNEKNWSREKYKKSLRHWLITELGHKGTENIHLHGIIWTDHGLDEIENHWKYGFIHKGKKINLKNNTYTYKNFVNERTINYNTKYVTKIDVQHKTYKPIILTSSGIGSSYTNGHGDHINNKYNGTKTNETYRTRQGYKLSLPKYLRNKIYTDQEREQLWLQKLDKNERWVDKQRIDISKSMDTYYKILDQAREKNKQLGYGTNEKNWSREKYERERRNLIIQTRINNARNNNNNNNNTTS